MTPLERLEELERRDIGLEYSDIQRVALSQWMPELLAIARAAIKYEEALRWNTLDCAQAVAALSEAIAELGDMEK